MKNLRELAPYKKPTSKEMQVATPARTKFFASRTPGQQDFSNNLDPDNRVENINEIAKSTLLSYINKTQEGGRYFSDMGKIDQRLKSHVLAQKKTGQSRERPKVMATNESINYKDNATVSHLQAIAKNSDYKRARFVIHPTGKMTGGDAYYYAHHDLGGGDPKNIEGNLYHNNDGSFEYSTFHGGSARNYTGSHPMLDRFDNHGMKRLPPLSFNENLNEIFDSSYDYKKTLSKQVTPNWSTHTYSFKSPADKYKVQIDHNHKHNEMDVTMRSSKGDTKISGAEGHNAHRVFGTMKKIMDDHAQSHGVGRVTFYGAKDGQHEGRNKLYNHMFKDKANFHSEDQGEGIHYSYMNEAWTERKPAMNVGINSLKNIAKGAVNKTARFSIQDNRMNAGDAHYFQHDDLINNSHLAKADGSVVNGYITHHPETDKFHYAAYTNKGKGFEGAQHTILQKMKISGIERGIHNEKDSKVRPLTAQDKPGQYREDIKMRDIVPEAVNPKDFHTPPHKKKKSNIDPNHYDYSTPLSEADDVHIVQHPRRLNKFAVIKNPDKKDARGLANDVDNDLRRTYGTNVNHTGMGEIRTLKHDNNLYAWKADDSTHHTVKNQLGISTNDHSEHGYFSSVHLRNNKYDIHKTHAEHNAPMSESLHEISRETMDRYRDVADQDWSKQGDNVASANRKIATIPQGGLSARMNAYQARSTAMRQQSRRDKGMARADRLASSDAYRAQQNANEQVVTGGNQPYDNNKSTRLKNSFKQTIAPLVDDGINEISTALLQKYITKGAKNMANKAYTLGQASMEKKPSPDKIRTLKVRNRAAGIAQAAAKMASRDFTYTPTEKDDGDHEYR